MAFKINGSAPSLAFESGKTQSSAGAVAGAAITPTSLSLNGATIGFPSYNTGTSTARSYSTWYQAEDNLFVTAGVAGSYTNDFYAFGGANTTTYYNIGRYGDDINNFTKWSTFQFMIKKGSWFQVTTDAAQNYYSWTLS